MLNEKAKVGIALAVGLCVGGSIGYMVADRRLRSKAEEEIASVQDLYQRLRAEDAEQARLDWNPEAASEDESRFSDFDEADRAAFKETVVALNYAGAEDVAAAGDRDPNYIPPEYTEAGDEPFADGEIDEDLREEADQMRQIRVHNPNADNDPDDVTKWERSKNFPYVITESEFRLDEPGFEKISLNYYRGDDTLSEENGTFIPDQNGTAGDENLHRYFGYGSGDENLLYIRNERVGADFEITLFGGAYSQEVMGFEIEESMVKSSKKNIRKMRARD